MSDSNVNSNISASDLNPQKKPISEAKLAANRANAQKSTGPRTEAGKLKAASNSLKHGLFSIQNFEKFIHDPDVAASVIKNLTETYDAVTPTEVLLLHKLIHMELRFLQMESLYGEAVHVRIHQLINEPKPILATLLRELDRLPVRIARTTKLLREEIAERKKCENEANSDEPLEIIADPPKQPELFKDQTYWVVKSDHGNLEADKVPGLAHMFKTKPPSSADEARLLLRKFLDKIKEHAEANPPQPPESKK